MKDVLILENSKEKTEYALEGIFTSFDKPEPKEAPPTVFFGLTITWEDYQKFVGKTTFDNTIVYMKCTWDKDFFKKSGFYGYLRNKKRRDLINELRLH